LQRLVEECGLTQEALSEKVGKKRSTVSNYMRLLKLPAEVQLALKEGVISMGHAKAIAALPAEKQMWMLRKCVKKALSVRQAEELARIAAEKASASEPTAESIEEEAYPDSYLRLVEKLEGVFSQNISIKRTKSGEGGRITIGFSSDREIEEFIERFERRG
ncbi:MAG: helix-turn-helix domain-containing protein, partial [Alistipes sp.]|nr:helix-turn-helix domain-containing protein [Alistipes sp.]